jgi:hypothetical protein
MGLLPRSALILYALFNAQYEIIQSFGYALL